MKDNKISLKLTKRRNQWGEYKVRVYENGKLNNQASLLIDDTWEEAVASMHYLAGAYGLDIIYIDRDNWEAK